MPEPATDFKRDLQVTLEAVSANPLAAVRPSPARQMGITMFRRTFIALSLALASIFAFATPGKAAEHAPYTQAAFEAAQGQGRPILIDVYAPWCPTCRAQEPVLERLTAMPAYANLIVFRVDFDSQKDVLRRLGAQRQSTLIAFRGRRETGRNVGVTAYFEIERLLATTQAVR